MSLADQTRLRGEKISMKIKRSVIIAFLILLAIFCGFQCPYIRCQEVSTEDKRFIAGIEEQGDLLASVDDEGSKAELYLGKWMQITVQYFGILNQTYYICPYVRFQTTDVPTVGIVSWESSFHFLCLDEQFLQCELPKKVVLSDVYMELLPGTSVDHAGKFDSNQKNLVAGYQNNIISFEKSQMRTILPLTVTFFMTGCGAQDGQIVPESASVIWHYQIDAPFGSSIYENWIQAEGVYNVVASA